jgi:bacillithiol system protein YtxJ
MSARFAQARQKGRESKGIMSEWEELESISNLEEVLRESARQPVLFFKHSLTCPISARAFSQFKQYLESAESRQVRNCLIVVQSAREVSRHLAEAIGVRHESPQAILVRDGRATWDESHFGITSDRLISAVR